MTSADPFQVCRTDQDWVGVVANRSSGLGQGVARVERLVQELRKAGLGAQISWTPEERSALVRRASAENGCRGLVAVGGDGTVSALINEDPRVPISVLPSGTENLVASHFDFKRDVGALVATISQGRFVSVDLGLALGRRFVLMAGFGFDGDVVTRHHSCRTSRKGRVRPTHRVAYFEPILRSSFSYRFPAVTVQITDPGAEETLVGTSIFVFNLPRYALGLPFAPAAREDDGWLDLVVFREPGPFRALYYLIHVFCRSHLRHPSVFHRRVKKLIVTAQDAVPVQLDGDPGGFVLPSATGALDNGQISAALVNHPADHLSATIVSQAAAEWTVEILPAALHVMTRPERLPPMAADSGRQKSDRAIG
jgi:diacylglycerol kinase family enzyme